MPHLRISNLSPEEGDAIKPLLKQIGPVFYKFKEGTTEEEFFKTLNRIAVFAPGSIVYYSSPSRRGVNVPLDLFSYYRRISGPVSLERVEVGNRIFLFFGDLHRSNEGECFDNFQTLEQIVRGFVDYSKRSFGSTPSLDVFTETPKSVLLLKDTEYPLTRFVRYVNQCSLVGTDETERRQSETYAEQCGTSTRFHGTDLRFEFSESGLTYVLELDERFVNSFDEMIGVLSSSLLGIHQTLEFIKAFASQSSQLTEDVYKRILITVKALDLYPGLKKKLETAFLNFSYLVPDVFLSVFDRGRTEKTDHILTPYQALIKKQIESTEPDKVIRIFKYLLEKFVKDIMRYYGTDFFSILSLLSNLPDRPEEILKQYERRSVVPLSALESLERFDRFIESNEPTPDTRSLQAVRDRYRDDPEDKQILRLRQATVILSLRRIQSVRFITLLRVVYMDLYTLLRMERGYRKPREYEERFYRPVETEIVLFYGGKLHASAYAEYFRSQYSEHKSWIYEATEGSDGERCLRLPYVASGLFFPIGSIDQWSLQTNRQL